MIHNYDLLFTIDSGFIDISTFLIPFIIIYLRTFYIHKLYPYPINSTYFLVISTWQIGSILFMISAIAYYHIYTYQTIVYNIVYSEGL